MLKQHKLSDEHRPLPPGMDWIKAECEARGGFFLETENHMISYIPGNERLMVCFDNLASSRAVEMRQPFGFMLAEKQGWGTLGIMAKRMDWFQCSDLKIHLLELKSLGLFTQYPNVSMYGASMGAFGALAFAPLAPNATVLAFAPQSTLRPRIVGFERRYVPAMRLGSWTGPFTDAAKSLGEIGKAYIIYDPAVVQDKLHAERMAGPNIIKLPVPYFTHKIPPMLKRMDVLKPVAMEALTGELTRKRFYSLVRARRNAAPYLVSLVGAAQKAGHLKLGVSAGEAALNQVNNWKTRKALKDIKGAASAATEEKPAEETAE